MTNTNNHTLKVPDTVDGLQACVLRSADDYELLTMELEDLKQRHDSLAKTNLVHLETIKQLTAERDDWSTRFKSLCTELYDGLRQRGLKVGPGGRDSERLILSYCGALATLELQRHDALEAQEALKAQTVRIRHAILGTSPEQPGVDTEELAQRLKASEMALWAKLDRVMEHIEATKSILAK